MIEGRTKFSSGWLMSFRTEGFLERMNTPDVAFEKVDEMVRFASPVQSLERG